VQLRAWIGDGHGRVKYSTLDEVGRQLKRDSKVFELGGLGGGRIGTATHRHGATTSCTVADAHVGWPETWVHCMSGSRCTWAVTILLTKWVATWTVTMYRCVLNGRVGCGVRRWLQPLGFLPLPVESYLAGLPRVSTNRPHAKRCPITTIIRWTLVTKDTRVYDELKKDIFGGLD